MCSLNSKSIWSRYLSSLWHCSLLPSQRETASHSSTLVSRHRTLPEQQQKLTTNSFFESWNRMFLHSTTFFNLLELCSTAREHAARAPLASPKLKTRTTPLSKKSTIEGKLVSSVRRTARSKTNEITKQHGIGAWRHILSVCRCRSLRTETGYIWKRTRSVLEDWSDLRAQRSYGHILSCRGSDDNSGLETLNSKHKEVYYRLSAAVESLIERTVRKVKSSTQTIAQAPEADIDNPGFVAQKAALVSSERRNELTRKQILRKSAENKWWLY